MTTADVVVIAAGIVVSAGLVWFFFGSGRTRQRTEHSATGQHVTVVVRGGYTPARIEAVAGVPLRITFDRQESGDCSSRVVFPDLGITRALPANAKTTVDVLPPALVGHRGAGRGAAMQRVDFPTEQSEVPPSCLLSHHRPPQRHRHAAAVRRGVTLAVALLLATTVSVGPAWAHGGAGGAEEGYVMVQQALGHLAHDPSPKGVAAAEAKIQEALSATDQEGVDVAIVRQAQAALTAGRTEVAQQTLQKSIADAVAQLKPASGEQTGTTVVGEPLPGRGSLTGTDWTLGGVSLLLLVAGVGLALWFRPAQNLAQLRRGLTTKRVTGTDPDTDSPLPSARKSQGGHPS